MDFPATFTVLDTETTGFHPSGSEIIEIGAVRFRDGLPGEPLSILVKPLGVVPAKITEITGITQEMVDAEGIPIEDAMARLFEYTAGENTYVMHNAPFDCRFLGAYGFSPVIDGTATVVDTLKLARKLVPESPNHKLGTLIETLLPELAGFEAHRASDDAAATGRLFLKLGERAADPMCLAQLVSAPVRKAPRMGAGGSQAETLRLFREGKSLEEIAIDRGLSDRTVAGHFRDHIMAGDVSIQELLPVDRVELLLFVWRSVQASVETARLRDAMAEAERREIKCTWEELGWAQAAIQRELGEAGLLVVSSMPVEKQEPVNEGLEF